MIVALLLLSCLWSVEVLGDSGYSTALHQGGPAAVASDDDRLSDDTVQPAPPPAGGVLPSPRWHAVGASPELQAPSPLAVRILRPARGPPATVSS